VNEQLVLLDPKHMSTGKKYILLFLNVRASLRTFIRQIYIYLILTSFQNSNLIPAENRTQPITAVSHDAFNCSFILPQHLLWFGFVWGRGAFGNCKRKYIHVTHSNHSIFRKLWKQNSPYHNHIPI